MGHDRRVARLGARAFPFGDRHHVHLPVVRRQSAVRDALRRLERGLRGCLAPGRGWIGRDVGELDGPRIGSGWRKHVGDPRRRRQNRQRAPDFRQHDNHGQDWRHLCGRFAELHGVRRRLHHFRMVLAQGPGLLLRPPLLQARGVGFRHGRHRNRDEQRKRENRCSRRQRHVGRDHHDDLQEHVVLSDLRVQRDDRHAVPGRRQQGERHDWQGGGQQLPLGLRQRHRRLRRRRRRHQLEGSHRRGPPSRGRHLGRLGRGRIRVHGGRRVPVLRRVI